MDNIVVAVIDDERDMRESIGQFLTISGFKCRTFETATEVLNAASRHAPLVVVSDIRMPKMDGMALLSSLMATDTALPVILITGHGDVQMAIEAIRLGAYDFIEKPFDPEQLVAQVRRAAEARLLTLDNRALRRALSDPERLDKIFIGQSDVMANLRELVLDFAQSEDNVFIEGETGTGRTLIARAVHACSPRQSSALIEINCAAYDESRLEAELFEDDSPAAVFRRPEAATLILENIDQLPERLQSRLAEHLGRDEDIDMPRIRVVAIREPVTEDNSRIVTDDLFYRLAGKKIDVPPLRDRGSDILALFTHYTERFALDYGTEPLEIGSDLAAKLLVAKWPGNIRQMKNLAEKLILARDPEAIANLVDSELLPANFAGIPKACPLKTQVEAFEQMLIAGSLRRHGGSIAAVMEELALPRRTLNEKMARYGLSRADFAS